jgi:two-component system chemotaxis response regulator CheY
MSDEQDERRLSPRVTALLMIEYPNKTGFIVDYLIDLSQGGLFIRTKMPLQVGDEIEFTISFPGLLEPIPLRGVVRRLAGDKEKDPGVGVEFIFTDDQTKQTVEKLVDQFRAEAELPPATDNPYRILVTYDNQRVLEMFKFALERLHLEGKRAERPTEIHTASNGREALDILQSIPIDLVILDQYMPELDGMSVLRMMRAEPTFKDTPVVMINTDHEQLKMTSLRSGANMFVAKPVRASTLLNTLSALIGEGLEKK